MSSQNITIRVHVVHGSQQTNQLLGIFEKIAQKSRESSLGPKSTFYKFGNFL
jgi:hypothetical protein